MIAADYALLLDALLYLSLGAAAATGLSLLADWLERRWPWQDHWR